MGKLLTIVIPTYNMEKFLHTCLDSLLIDKGLEQLEVLVVNDGSKDKSSVIAHEYETSHPESFHVIDKENGNYGSCINRGLKEATGKYIKILDADDHFDKPSLRLFLQQLSTTNADLVLTDYVIFGDNDFSKKRYGFDFPTGQELRFKEIIQNDAFKISLQMHNVAYRRDIFRQFDYHQAEDISYTDTQWVFTPMAFVDSVIYFSIPLYYYLVGRAGQTMAPEQQRRSASHYIVLAKTMLNDYDTIIRNSEQVKVFLDFRLARLMKYVYRVFLAEWEGIDLSELISIDEQIRVNHPALYEETGRRTMGPFIRIRYVNYWRRHNHSKQPHLFYVIFNTYNRTLNLAKQIFHIKEL
ncbi:MAG: glycosyltransferase [Prevotella sp.]|nr:glycosyltransferase [Prevotella sp.]